MPKEHYNELGVRKYDLPALFRRIRHHFRGPFDDQSAPWSLLPGSGRHPGACVPLRYEKRVARPPGHCPRRRAVCFTLLGHRTRLFLPERVNGSRNLGLVSQIPLASWDWFAQ